MSLLNLLIEQDSANDSPCSLSLSLTSLKNPSWPQASHSTQTSIICTGCNNTYTNPKVLPCLHTFCANCIELKNKKITCPLCNIDFCSPVNGVEGLIPDYAIMKFIQSLNANLFCTSCKIDTIGAVAKCIDCEHYLCHNCHLAHSHRNCFRTPQVIQFPLYFSPNKNDTMKDETRCTTHTEVVKYFCMNCNKPTCDVCLLHDHLGHHTDPIEFIADTMITAMDTMMNENKCRIEDLSSSINYSSLAEQQLNSQYQVLLNGINETYNRFSSMLLKHKQAQDRQLDTCFSEFKRALSNNCNLSKDTLEKTSYLTGFYSRLTKFTNMTQCLMFKKLLETKHNRLISYKLKPLQFNLELITDNNDFINSMQNCFGHVVSDFNNESEVFSRDVFNMKDYYQPQYPCLEDLKALTDYKDLPFIKPSIKSTVSRQVIAYKSRFGGFGSSQGELNEPNGVAVNAEGDIIIADTNNKRVQVFDKNGSFKFLFGEGSNKSDGGSLLFPNRVAVVEKTGDIIVTERSPTHQVQIYNQYGHFIRKFGADVLEHPRAVAVDKDGLIIVVECKVMRVVIFNQMGEVVEQFTCRGTLDFPNGVAVNDQREIFISDNRSHCVVVYDYKGIFLRHIGHKGLTNYPIGVMLNKAGQIIVADNHYDFNLTFFNQDGQIASAVKSKHMHLQCYDAAISSEGTIILATKDCNVYIYQTDFL